MKKIFLLISLLAILAPGCWTLRSGYTSARWLGMAPADGDGYLFVGDMDGAKPYLEWAENRFFPEDEVIKKILSKTGKLCASMIIDKSPVFSLFLGGNYNSFLYGVGLAFSPGWKQVGAPAKYYIHIKSGIRVAIPDISLIIITNGDIEELLAKYKNPDPLSIPPYLDSRIETADLFLYFPEFAETAVPPGLPFNKRKLPVREALITSRSVEEDYFLAGFFNLQDGKNAKLFLRGMKTFIVWWMMEADQEEIGKKLRGIDITADDKYVIVDKISYSYGEVWQAIKVFFMTD